MRRIFLISIATAAALVITVAATQTTNSAAQADCVPVFNGVQSEVCTANAKGESIGWLKWAQFKSKSVQLHFLDLVELVFGTEPARSVQRTPADDQSRLVP
ncbi:MAG: hypothetical protein HLUCCO02_06355 [Idiomarinaceae bacterium HL-53]|nr:MAG: hypothetical protein HLUCCO02_06355 [Idiomarinaceae bacterium HL-53]CUS48175.1 hypothetical protein Ga0003345_1114 [Idiomarinaceae bacterium HL-53]